jgi:hypothetical protein
MMASYPGIFVLDYHEQSKLKPPPRQEVDRLLQKLANSSSSSNSNNNSSSSGSRPVPTCTQPVQKVKMKAPSGQIGSAMHEIATIG